MQAAAAIREARRQHALTLRGLALRAHTSHATLAAYEHGRVIPSVATLDRILSAAGLHADITLTTRISGRARADELAEVLDLAGQFPARHARRLAFPRFGAPGPGAGVA